MLVGGRVAFLHGAVGLDSMIQRPCLGSASVPRAPIVYLLAGNTAFLASLWHDYLYGTGLEPKEVADAIFAEIMDAKFHEDGPYDERIAEPGWRRALMWTGVGLFGASHYKGEDGEPKAGFALPASADD